MGNCLKTQLKESVQNSNLVKMGEWILPVVTRATIADQTQQNLSLNITQPTKLTVDGGYVGTSIADLANKKTSMDLVVGYHSLFFANFDDNNNQLANYTVHFDNKYGIGVIRLNGQNSTNIHILVPNISELKYSSLTFVRVQNANYKCDLSIFEGNNLITDLDLSVCSSSVTGDLSSLSDCTALTKLSIVRQYALTGSISSISNLTNLTVLDLSYSTAITGDISALAAFDKLTNAEFMDCSHITGSLSSLAASRNTICRVYMTGTGLTGNLEDIGYVPVLDYILIRNTSVGGSIEAFVEANKARTSGHNGFDARYSNCTFHGTVPTIEFYAVYFDDRVVISTDDAGSNVLATYTKDTNSWVYA